MNSISSYNTHIYYCLIYMNSKMVPSQSCVSLLNSYPFGHDVSSSTLLAGSSDSKSVTHLYEPSVFSQPYGHNVFPVRASLHSSMSIQVFQSKSNVHPSGHTQKARPIQIEIKNNNQNKIN